MRLKSEAHEALTSFLQDVGIPQTLHSDNAKELIMGRTPDISSLAEFDFYEPVYYFEPAEFPNPKCHIARWLGEAINIGQVMTYYILPISGVPIA